MNGDPQLYQTLGQLGIAFDYHEHPPAPTIVEAMKYWKDLEATHCKNIFFRNHKGNRHYLVVIDHRAELDVHSLEQSLKQGKLSFASGWRLKKYLGVEAGSVSPLGLIHDQQRHIHLFLDEKLQHADKISFHPLVNTASLILRYTDFLRFLNHQGNTWEYIPV